MYSVMIVFIEPFHAGASEIPYWFLMYGSRGLFQLETARIAASKMSPMMETINMVR